MIVNLPFIVLAGAMAGGWGGGGMFNVISLMSINPGFVVIYY